jgi:hypothetical protein
MMIRPATADDLNTLRSAPLHQLTGPETWQPLAAAVVSPVGDGYVMIADGAPMGTLTLSKISPDSLAISLLEVVHTAVLEQVVAALITHARETVQGTDIRRFVIRCDPSVAGNFTMLGAEPIAELPAAADRGRPLRVLEIRLPSGACGAAAAAAGPDV